MILGFAFAAGLTLLFVLLFAVAAVSQKASPQTERLIAVVSAGRTEALVYGQHKRFESHLSSIMRRFRKRLGIRMNERLRDRLSGAGIRSVHAPDMFSAVQCFLPLLGVTSATLLHENILFWAFLLGGIAYLLPGIWLTHRINVYREILRRSLPDTMDLLVICVDAGLGMDQALIRVTEELATSHQEMQQELRRVQLEQRAGSSRLEA